ncbi:hypothetical protein PLANPX_5652 [Lacipirellula parvula]|uniref:Uncharacterized protein n=1 Tax=Lacipirellula parvula TaxID=2650471 RepID=A0A5K7XGQ2_9BACT|nr:hypothetical protein PLANPX_5652 [Lacipirellula parvula]
MPLRYLSAAQRVAFARPIDGKSGKLGSSCRRGFINLIS